SRVVLPGEDRSHPPLRFPEVERAFPVRRARLLRGLDLLGRATVELLAAPEMIPGTAEVEGGGAGHAATPSRDDGHGRARRADAASLVVAVFRASSYRIPRKHLPT